MVVGCTHGNASERTRSGGSKKLGVDPRWRATKVRWHKHDEIKYEEEGGGGRRRREREGGGEEGRRERDVP